MAFVTITEEEMYDTNSPGYAAFIYRIYNRRYCGSDLRPGYDTSLVYGYTIFLAITPQHKGQCGIYETWSVTTSKTTTMETFESGRTQVDLVLPNLSLE